MAISNKTLIQYIQAMISYGDWCFLDVSEPYREYGYELSATEVFELCDLITDDLIAAYATDNTARFLQVLSNELFNYDIVLERQA